VKEMQLERAELSTQIVLPLNLFSPPTVVMF